VALHLGEVLAYGVPLIAVNAPLALLKVHGVGRQVPVHDCVAVLVEVKPLLADGGCSEHKRPEGRVEGCAHMLGAHLLLIVLALVTAEAHGKSAA
jgi:hypothetical protein